MKILTGKQSVEKTANFELVQSSGDVDIHCDGAMVAFFKVGSNNKVSLWLVDGVDASIFNIGDTRNGSIEVK